MMSPSQQEPERELERIASTLGASYSCEACDGHRLDDGSNLADELLRVAHHQQQQPQQQSTHMRAPHQPSAITASLPCLSLDSEVCASSNERSDIKLHAAALLSRPITASATNELQHMPQTLLENIYSSFDVLVDARIRVYTRVLSSHGLLLRSEGRSRNDGVKRDNDNNNHEQHKCLGTKAIEYKLRTLLEIGTTLSADKVSTKFARTTTKPTVIVASGTTSSSSTATTTTATRSKTTITTIPAHESQPRTNPSLDAEAPRKQDKQDQEEVSAEADASADAHHGSAGTTAAAMTISSTSTSKSTTPRIQSLVETSSSVPASTGSPSSSSDAAVVSLPLNFQASIQSLKIGNRDISLSFQASASITGTWNAEQNFFLEGFRVDVDADQLLSSMMREATRVVSILVEVTNEAWSNFVINTMLVPCSQEDEDEEEDCSDASVGEDSAATATTSTTTTTAASSSAHSHPEDGLYSSPCAVGNGTVIVSEVRTDCSDDNSNSCSVSEPGIDERRHQNDNAHDDHEHDHDDQPRRNRAPSDAAKLPSVVTRHNLASISSSSKPPSSSSISSLVSEDSTSNLDAEKCANIVDFVIGEVKLDYSNSGSSKQHARKGRSDDRGSVENVSKKPRLAH
eukprot:CAMPEP_0119546484 /NCGR_PEP_ID=MMETSP1352-20130426/887_1 /TAXON_ID=265584 /ORGANISM="Stauroneis constricta, Strain CCMP1120" /LENGTH=627 /DNA_ID=CAMNT_0007591195 /DNA_START=228 /DNA_END=2111 /DNA_ORIENTATION=+